jgi:hypothetical protein
MRVTMDVFSGRPNPQWRLSTAQALELRDRLIARPRSALPRPPSRLGLRRFLIEPEIGDVALGYTTPLVVDAPAAPSAQAGGPPADIVVDFLLQTAAGTIDETSLRAIRRNAPAEGAKVAAPRQAYAPAARAMARRETAAFAAQAVCEPLLTPMNALFWDYPPICVNNNCYNYATNCASNTVAQPGRRSGQIYSAFDCGAVRAAALADGVLDVCIGTPRVIALAIWPGIDFHWWRMHPGGFWASKLGTTSVWNVDNSGRLIGYGLTPENCDRGPYTVFCGFFFAPLGITVV